MICASYFCSFDVKVQFMLYKLTKFPGDKERLDSVVLAIKIELKI